MPTEQLSTNLGHSFGGVQLSQTMQNNVSQAAQRKSYFGHDDKAGVLSGCMKYFLRGLLPRSWVLDSDHACLLSQQNASKLWLTKWWSGKVLEIWQGRAAGQMRYLLHGYYWISVIAWFRLFTASLFSTRERKCKQSQRKKHRWGVAGFAN